MIRDQVGLSFFVLCIENKTLRNISKDLRKTFWRERDLTIEKIETIALASELSEIH